MTESFSYKVRGTATGGAYNIGRLGAVLAPVTIGYFAQGGSLVQWPTIGVWASICQGLILHFSIETSLFDPQKLTNLQIKDL